MNWGDISFAQPFWLWFLILIPVGWIWSLFWQRQREIRAAGLQKFIDQNLLPHLLLKAATSKRSKIGYLYSLLVFFVIVALANPRWSYTDLDAFQPTASMVIILDLANSMNATDVSPSRIMRARQNIEDLLNLSKGLKVGLIGFAGYPHLISPITDDLETIRNYIPALDTDLSNVQGNSLHLALNMANELLTHEPGDKKSIVLISDGNTQVTDYSKELQQLNANNIHVHVVGIGTTSGAPYKNKSGALQKQNGKIVVSKLNVQLLKDIAKQGHGVYTEAGYSDIGLRTIIAKTENSDHEHLIAGKVRQWHDRYYWFLIPAIATLAMIMRQKSLLSILFVIALQGAFAEPVYAVVPNMFKNSEQIGQDYYAQADFNQAAATFQDPYRKGVAYYRQGEFAQAEEQFKLVERRDVRNAALYNAGNAQMQQKKWAAAIDSYEAVLREDPENFAAQHNLEIARKMLESEPENSDSDCECNNKKDQQNAKNGKSKDSKSKSDDKSTKDTQDQQRQAANDQKQNSQQQQNKREQQHEQQKQHDQQQNQRDLQEQQQQNQHQQNQQQAAKAHQARVHAQAQQEEAQIEQMLNRVDSDIKVFLMNKFYVEDLIGAQ